MVEVDVHSGRPNPEVPLDDEAARRLHDLVTSRAGSGAVVDEPDWPLGFRGFVVAVDLANPDWTAVRVLPDRFYVLTDVGLTEVPDEPGEAYAIVREAIEDDLDPEVLAAIDTPG